jgi:hypothetical protein
VFWILLLFFLLGQLALLGITYAFRWLTSYDDVQEIAAGSCRSPGPDRLLIARAHRALGSGGNTRVFPFPWEFSWRWLALVFYVRQVIGSGSSWGAYALAQQSAG